jgi:hypothetical protein
MKWPAKHTRIEPLAGTTRINNRFAWLPTYINGFIVWLSWFEALQVYRITEEKVTIDDKTVTFLPGKWVNITKRCKI